MKIEPDEEVLKEKERHDKLLTIPGVMISDVEVREYPLGEAAAHLVGYVQSVTAEDLEEHAGEGYTANSVIGRSGMEGLFESELKGQNGCRICIVNAKDKEKEELACILVQHGAGIQLEYAWTPMYDSYYIEGINHLYEFDCGSGSGWMYKVNGWFPNYGCSSYHLEDGDSIVWIYTCQLGDDIGGGNF